MKTNSLCSLHWRMWRWKNLFHVIYVHKSDIFQVETFNLFQTATSRDFSEWKKRFFGLKVYIHLFWHLFKRGPPSSMYVSHFTYMASRKCQSKTNKENRLFPPLCRVGMTNWCCFSGVRRNPHGTVPKKWHVTKLGFVVDCWEVCQQNNISRGSFLSTWRISSWVNPRDWYIFGYPIPWNSADKSSHQRKNLQTVLGRFLGIPIHWKLIPIQPLVLQGAFFHLVGGIWPTKTKLCSIHIICRAQLRGKITYLLRQHADLRFQHFDGMCVVRCENLDEPPRFLGIWLMNFRDPSPSLGHSCSWFIRIISWIIKKQILTFPKNSVKEKNETGR